AEDSTVAQWLVTELIAPPTRALQLHLFTGGRAKPWEKARRNRRQRASSGGAARRPTTGASPGWAEAGATRGEGASLRAPLRVRGPLPPGPLPLPPRSLFA